MCLKPFPLTKNEGKLFLVPKSSGPLLAGLPLKREAARTMEGQVTISSLFTG